MKLTGVNTSTWTKVCLIATLFTTNSTCTGLTSNVGFRDNTVTMLWARQPRNCCLMTVRAKITVQSVETRLGVLGVLRVGFLSQRVKQLRREADHSPPSNAKAKNEWSYISSSLYSSMASTRTTLPLSV